MIKTRHTRAKKGLKQMKKEAFYSQMPDGTEIYYEKSGVGEPLFLLHGNGDSGGYFSHQVPLFEKYFTVYVIDSRAHGKSNNTQPYLDFPLMADDLVQLMAQESLTDVTILGFSDGANLALVFSVLYPQKVRALVLNSGNIFVSGVKFWANWWSYIQLIWFWLGHFFITKYQQKLSMIRLMLHDSGVSESQLHQIACPTLIIVGYRDLVTLRHSKFLAQSIPQASFVRMKGENHFYARRNPDSFNQEVLVFLNSVGEVEK